MRAEDPELASRVMRGEVSLRRAIRELRRRANGDLVMARQRPVGIEAARRAEEAARLRARRACAEHEQALAHPRISFAAPGQKELGFSLERRRGPGRP